MKRDRVTLTPAGRAMLELHEQLACVDAMRRGAARAGVDLVARCDRAIPPEGKTKTTTRRRRRPSEA